MYQQQDNTKQQIVQLKVILLGQSKVGKTSILTRFVKDQFNFNTESTAGVNFLDKVIECEGQNYGLKIWDTAGQEQYRSIAKLYYRQSDIAIIVYDITDKQSFDCVKSYIDELKSQGLENITLAIIGNKCDLIDDQKVNYDIAKSYARSQKALFRLTSAKENKGIKEIFQEILRKRFHDSSIIQERNSINNSEKDQKQNNSFQLNEQINNNEEKLQNNNNRCSC